MLKVSSIILAAAMALTPVAAAESLKEVTLKMDYDPALLTSETGAETVVSQLKREARKVCSQRLPAIGSVYVDTNCADTLVKAAVQQIHADVSDAGQAVAPEFQRLAAVDYALAN
ncbi:MAG: UrcA family protein [Hyphomonas sp.]